MKVTLFALLGVAKGDLAPQLGETSLLQVGASTTEESMRLQFYDLLQLTLSVKQFPSCAPLDYVMHNDMVEKTPDGLPNGLVLEFGVFNGGTVNRTARFFSGSTVHGFDSFAGLPELWPIAEDGRGYNAGFFAPGGKKCGTKDQEWHDLCGDENGLPPVEPNVRLHKGWFNETIPKFLETLPSPQTPIALLHVDSDLYVSAKSIFDALKPNIVPGTVIVFDEIVGYARWREGEALALYEFLHDNPDLGVEVFGKRQAPATARNQKCNDERAPREDWRGCTKFCDCEAAFQSAAFKVVPRSGGAMVTDGAPLSGKC